jgi:two-component system NtrC family sensor kinase
MKLTIKLILVAMTVILAVVSVQAVMRAQGMSERSLHRTRHELAALALALGATTDELWRAAGPDAAQRLVERVDQSFGRAYGVGDGQAVERSPDQVHVRLERTARADGVLSAGAFGALPSDARAERIEQREDELRIALAVGAGGLLEIRKPLAAHHAAVRSARWSEAAHLAVLALFGTVTLLVAGTRLLEWPLRALVARVRTLADGDDAGRPRDQQPRDELGTLASELERMSERLESAWDEMRRDRWMRTSTFERLRRADRLSTVGKLASSMAHDLGTPLNVVSGRAMMIMSTPSCPAEISSDARIIGEQANNMTRIIRRMLDHTRRRDLQLTSTPLTDLLQRAITLVEPLAEEQEVTIEHVRPLELVVTVDENKVLQVLTILMVNGVEAMPGGGRLRLQASVLDVEEPPDSRAAAGTYVRISVEDSGAGIDANALDKIFEPFFSTKGGGEGTGLGLTVSHSIIRDHGGWLEAHSQPGHGSRFDVYLPQSNDEGEHR